MYKLPDKLLWLDLEMTGLDPDSDRILEVGAIVTDFELREIEHYEALIKQPERVLDRMKSGDWYNWSSGVRKRMGTVYDMHAQNGLLERVRQDGRREKDVEAELIELVSKHFDSAVYLAGNSIHQDRRFILRWWPKFEAKLHYRMVDVSSFKVFLQGRYGLEYHHPDTHRALDGIRGSISELSYYLKQMPKLLNK